MRLPHAVALIAAIAYVPTAFAQTGVKFHWSTHTQLIVRAGNNQQTVPPNRTTRCRAES